MQLLSVWTAKLSNKRWSQTAASEAMGMEHHPAWSRSHDVEGMIERPGHILSYRGEFEGT